MGRAKKALIALTVWLAAVACTVDIESEAGKVTTPEAPEGKVEVKFEVKTNSLASRNTRAEDTYVESIVNDLTLIMMKSDGKGGFVGDYIMPITAFAPSGPATYVFVATMEPSETEVKLLFVANKPASVSDYFEAHADDFGDLGITEEELRTTLTDNAPVMTMTMTGEVTLGGIDKDNVSVVTVPLIRCVAKVELLLNLEPGSPDFVPTTVTTYRVNKILQILPGLETFDDPVEPSKVVAPTVPDATQKQSYYTATYTRDPESGSFSIFTVTENRQATTPDERMASTVIVVGGRFEGGPITYYRIDFNSQEAGHPYGQILRNYHYVFNITRVMQPGYDDIVSAAESVSSAIVTENSSEVVLAR